MRKLLEGAQDILIGGHRGCSCSHPENSIAAMEEGLRQGANYLEIDVQLTSDGVPVVFHDTRLETGTPLSGYVHEHSLSALTESVEGLCTLTQALAWGKERDAYLALEIKSVPLLMQPVNFKLAELLCAQLTKIDFSKNVLVFGADYQVLKHFKKTLPPLEIGLIIPFVPQNPVALMEDMGALLYLSYVYNMTEAMILQLQDQGYYVSGAILRDEKWIQQAVSLRVNLFESDFPKLHRTFVESLSTK